MGKTSRPKDASQIQLSSSKITKTKTKRLSENGGRAAPAAAVVKTTTAAAAAAGSAQKQHAKDEIDAIFAGAKRKAKEKQLQMNAQKTQLKQAAGAAASQQDAELAQLAGAVDGVRHQVQEAQSTCALYTAIFISMM